MEISLPFALFDSLKPFTFASSSFLEKGVRESQLFLASNHLMTCCLEYMSLHLNSPAFCLVLSEKRFFREFLVPIPLYTPEAKLHSWGLMSLSFLSLPGIFFLDYLYHFLGH